MTDQSQMSIRDSRIINAMLMIVDPLVIIATAIISYVAYLPLDRMPDIYGVVTGYVALLTLLVFSKASLYDDWGRSSRSEEIRKLSLSWFMVFMLTLVTLILIKAGEQVSRAWILTWFVTGWSWLIAIRFLVRSLEKLAYRRGVGQRSVVLVGDKGLCARVVSKISEMEVLGYKVKAVCVSGENVNDFIDAGVDIANISEVESYVKVHNIYEVWIALPLREEKQLQSIIHLLRNSAVDIRYLPDLFGMRLLNHSVASVAGMPLVNLSITPIAGMNGLIKLIEDYVLSLLILISVSPLLVIIAVLVKTTSKGPIIYKQERISWNGRPFMMYKFRSMPTDVEERTGPKWAKSGEDRATFIGSILRKTSLDELPQFVNVLKGDMSIVGPRPERPVFVERFKDDIQDYMKKHLVKAGITGWAQVNGLRGDTDLKKRIEYDLYYIEHWSLWFDIKIIFMTLFKGFSSKNAY